MLHTDHFAVSLGYAPHLGRSLIKLQIQNLSSMDADPLYSSFHHSHPILTERLKAMRWSEIREHEDKEKDEKDAVRAQDREL